MSKKEYHIDNHLYVCYLLHIDEYQYVFKTGEFMTIEKTAEICRALGDENRLKIIGLLTGGELCACRILEKLDITQPTLSHHIKILCECGLVNARRDGKWMHYSINCETFSEFKQYFDVVKCCGKN